MKTIILTGRLGKKFGRHFSLDVATPAEAIRAFCVMIEGFEAELRKGAYRILRVMSDGSLISHSERDLQLEFGSATTLRIEPTVKGSKSGLFNIVLGVILVGAAFAFTGGVLSATVFSAFGATVTGSQLALIGGLMALSGAASMISPQMQANPSSTNEPASFMINTPTNWAEQGHPVPLVYGNPFCGSIVVSNGITTEDYSPDV